MSDFLTDPSHPHTVNSLADMSPSSLQELVNYLTLNPPYTPIANVIGYQNAVNSIVAQAVTQASAQAARDASESVFNNTTYGDPNVSGSAGPSLTGLADGQYLVLYGASLSGSTGGTQQSFANISINGATPSTDDNAIEAQQALNTSVSGAIIVTLSSGSNSLKLVYRNAHGDTVKARYRWLTVLRFAA